jgi:hypothetical protein
MNSACAAQVGVKIDTERFTRVFMERVRGGRVF